MTTKRKPYVRGMSADWWSKLSFYKSYMLREMTAITALWFSCILIYAIFCIKGSENGLLQLILFLRNPIVLVINIVALVGALLHTKTWFDLTPKAANIVTKSGHKIAPELLVKVMWAIMIVATLIILAIVLL